MRVDLPDKDDESRDEHDLGEVPPPVSVPGPLESNLSLLQFDEGDLLDGEVRSRFGTVAVSREGERERWEKGEEALEGGVEKCYLFVQWNNLVMKLALRRRRDKRGRARARQRRQDRTGKFASGKCTPQSSR